MKEICVVVKNHPGVLAEIAELLARHGVNIEQIAAEGIGKTGIIQVQVDRYDTALSALRDAGYRAMTEDCLLIRLPDQPGALAGIAKRFKDAQINIRSIHIVERKEGVSIAAVSTDRTDHAMRLLKDVLIRA